MNSISQYEEMKDSGIKWIGKVPVEWNIRRLYQIVTRVNNKNTELAEQNLLSLSYGKIKRKDINTKDGLLPASFDGYNIIEGGDIVLRLTDLQNDHTSLRVGHAMEKGIITSAYITIRPINPAHSDYLYYLIHAFDLKKGFYGMGSGVRQGLNYDEVKELHIVIPSQDEQNAIVAYLDDQCAQIDSLVQEAKETIEEYKKWRAAIIFEAVTKGLDSSAEMKNSGVEWIGMMPGHWEKKRLCDIASYKKGPFGSELKISMFVPKGENTYKVYEQKNAIYKDCSLGYYYISKKKYEDLQGFAVVHGDVIVSCAGTIGECYILPENIEAGIINQALMRIRFIIDIEPRYFLSLFSIILRYAGEKYSNGSAIKNIPPFNILKKLKIPFPPINVQKQIVAYLDEKCATIDEIIAEKESLITDLESYKKSLIYEVVTGKRKVVQS